jgi:amidohydrolase
MTERQSLEAWNSLPTVSPAVRAIAREVVGYRRHAHRFPEVSWEERETQRWLLATLEGFGITEITLMAGTGLKALVRGGRPGRTVLWRADIDALPIHEEVDAPYTSTRPGVMHACGHDGHIAVALGLARLMQAERETLAGNVVFAFQPAEEVGGGARPMIAEGVLDDPPVAEVFGFHADSSVPCGAIAVSPGEFFAAPATFELVIRGRGGHAGLPHRSVDPVVCAAYVLTALQSVVSRNVPPDRAGVLSIGHIEGGTRGNIIPDVVRIEGTLRAFEPETMRLIQARFEQVIKGVTEAFGAEYQLTYRGGLPAVVNDAASAALVREVAAAFLGEGNVLPDRTTMSDDMALFLQARPGCYYLLGVRNEAWGIVEPNHSPRWDLDERALVLGVELGRRILHAALTRPRASGETRTSAHARP